MLEKKPMQLGMIGLGRMGANMVRRLIPGGLRCVVFDQSAEVVKRISRRIYFLRCVLNSVVIWKKLQSKHNL